MNLEWLNLRTFNGDQKNGFEELVCQLARVEKITGTKKFVRVGVPDGGVESYWILDNNDEYGWQAKFFYTMEDSQWAQIESSFKTAFAKHPNLKKYFVCTPLDRSDPRIVTKKGTVVKHFMDVWNEKVAQWEAYAQKIGRTIEFEYWGNSELFERLSKPNNEGKLYYWFHQEEFSESWFKQNLEDSVRNLGKRYTPEINFDLPIAKTFDGLSRGGHFKKQFEDCLHDLFRNYNSAVSHVRVEKVAGYVSKIAAEITQFKQLFEQIDFIENDFIDQVALSKPLDTCNIIVDELIDKLYELDAKEKKEKKGQKENEWDTNRYAWDIDYFRKLNSAIYRVTNFLDSSTLILSNKPFLILTGEAGIGKSHLLADLAKKRDQDGQFTILLLGQLFTTTEDPWSQIIKLLQIDCKKDTFLSALNSKAESIGSRILFFIDAINEGEGKVIWKNHMSGFITAISRFPYLGVVFSLRTSYEKLLLPDSIKEKKEALKIVHRGFANHEYEASKLFFENYEIKQPSIPLLHPEFSNPLFLKLFCEGLNKKGLHEIPDGYEGITAIINFYLDSINHKISEKHNLPLNLQTVQKVIKRLAQKIIENNKSYMKFDEAFSFIVGLPETSVIIDKSQFFQDLISEGLLTQNLYWGMGLNHFEGVYITYERFSDHLIASYLLGNFLNKKNPERSFSEDTKFLKAIKGIGQKMGFQFQPKRLYELLKTEEESEYNRGIIEALSIQLPEQLNLELYEVAIHAKGFTPVVGAFVESIPWRKKETANKKLIDYINEVVIKEHGYHDYFISTILLITSQPENYFNSDFLHENLMKYNMADRDEWWTQFIHNQYPGDNEEATIVRRMIDWAWTEDKRGNISDESIRLMCQTLAWFLTSCNRTLRDAATKALICLLEHRLNVLIQLLTTFGSVNDPYVLQRLYAVAYGCAVRSTKAEFLKELGDYIFSSIFNTDNVLPDILLRDYAKGIIEYAIFRGYVFEFDIAKTQPPFKSDLPKVFPSNEETDKYEYDYKSKDFKDYYWSQNSILHSMVTEYGRGTSGYGDFGRYTFQSALDDWKDLGVNSLSNLAVKWIIEKYGYNVEKHGKFDRNIGSGRGRENGHEERIGKKYQWIAFHEMLARVSDNYILYENSYSEHAKPIKYVGPWEPFVRDIDPTVTIKGDLGNESEKFWWNTVSYSNWDLSNKDWVLQTEDLPDPTNLVNVIDNKGVEWLILQAHESWEEPTPIGEDKYDNPRKKLLFDLCGYLVWEKDFQKIVDRLTSQSLRGLDLFEISRRYQMFSREFYWASSNNTFNTEYYSGQEWEKIYHRKSGQKIGNFARTALEYAWETELDASKDGIINFYKPTEIVFRLLDLQYSAVEGYLLNKENEIVCFDPSATIPTIPCLLVRKSDFLKVLAENKLAVIWALGGEKMIIGGHFNHTDYVGRLNISDLLYFKSDKLEHSLFYERE